MIVFLLYPMKIFYCCMIMATFDPFVVSSKFKFSKDGGIFYGIDISEQLIYIDAI